MFWKFDENKCKNKLVAGEARININIGKKTALVQKAKREIAGLLKDRKYEKARIKVEYVIREDFNIEALEILALICELLKTRIQLIAVEKECPQDLRESVGSLIWAADRIQIEELNDIKDQFRKKYGIEFVQQAEKVTLGGQYVPRMQPIQIDAPPGAQVHIHQNATFQNGKIVSLDQSPNLGGVSSKPLVNEKLMARLSIYPPKEDLVNNYLSAIAHHFQIDDYDPADSSSNPNLGSTIPMAPGSELVQAYTTPSDNNNNFPGGNNNGMGGSGFGGGTPYPPNNQYQPQHPSDPYPHSNGEYQPNTQDPNVPPMGNVGVPTQNNFAPPMDQTYPSNTNQHYPNVNNLPTATPYNPPSNGTGFSNDPNLDDLNARLQDLKR